MKGIVDFPVKLVEHELLERGYKGDPGVSVVRDDTKEIITNASSNYQLVKHIDILNAVEATFESNKMDYILQRVVWTGKQKSTMGALYRIPSLNYTINKDSHDLYLRVNNSYDTLSKFFIQIGFFRIICSNGLIIANKAIEESDRLMHVGENIKLDKVFTKVEKLIAKVVPELIKQIEILPTKPMTVAQAFNDEKLKNAFPTGKLYEQFQESGLLFKNFEQLGSNKYALLNAITEFATHHVDNDSHCLTLQEKALDICLN